MCLCSIFYRCGCDTLSVAVSVDYGLGLGTVFVVISISKVMAECNRILEKTAHSIA